MRTYQPVATQYERGGVGGKRFLFLCRAEKSRRSTAFDFRRFRLLKNSVNRPEPFAIVLFQPSSLPANNTAAAQINMSQAFIQRIVNYVANVRIFCCGLHVSIPPCLI